MWKSFAKQLLLLLGLPCTQADIDREAGRLRDLVSTYILALDEHAWHDKWGDLTRQNACVLVLSNDGWQARSLFADQMVLYACLAISEINSAPAVSACAR